MSEGYEVPTELPGSTGLSGFVFIAYVIVYELPCVMVYYIFFVFDFTFFWCPCMAINVSVQCNDGGLLPDIILLTQCYFHRGTRLNAMKRFCIRSL